MRLRSDDGSIRLTRRAMAAVADPDDSRCPCPTHLHRRSSNTSIPNGTGAARRAMPGVQSAAFTMLLPAGVAYEGADGLDLGGGAATMAAEWITRGAGRATAASC